MRILINVNEQVSATMMQKYFEASGLEAEVTAAPTNMMLENLKASKFDLIAFYAEEIDNESLISFLKSTAELRKILFVKKQNVALVSEELEDMLDECFTIPLDSNDLMVRLRRIYRAAEQKGSQSQPEEMKMAQEVPLQAAQYDATLFEPEPEPKPKPKPKPEPETDPEPEAELEPEIAQGEDYHIAPINMDSSYSTESFQQGAAYEVTPITAPPAEKVKAKEVETLLVSTEPDKGHRKKKKSPLRYLNKSELLEIILEQEKMIIKLSGENSKSDREAK